MVIIGGGTVGLNAAKAAVGSERISVLDVNLDRLRHLDDLFGGRIVTVASNSFTIGQAIQRADLLVGAVLITGARAPVLVSEAMVERMKPGAVIVDVAVDQGGCIATIHPTTLDDPIYQVAGVVHYGVANMPALVPRTSTFALANATLPYAIELCDRGPKAAVRANGELARGVNVWRGRFVHPGVARRSASWQCLSRRVRCGTMTRSVRSWAESATVERVSAEPVGHRINHRLRRRPRMDCGPVTEAVIVRGESRL